jgi:hypothetical protein
MKKLALYSTTTSTAAPLLSSLLEDAVYTLLAVEEALNLQSLRSIAAHRSRPGVAELREPDQRGRGSER